MVFSSFLFLSFFLPFVLLLNARLSIRASNVFLFFASLFFYYWGEASLVLLLIASITWNYCFGLLIGKFDSKIQLGIGIAGNLILLFYFKYFKFLVEAIGLEAFSQKANLEAIILPIGISFFTFQGISYLIDVYRKSNVREANLIKLGLYISFFPQLIAGPILKFKEFSRYLYDRKYSEEGVIEGSFKFIRGLFKKIVLANQFAVVSDAVFEINLVELSMPIAWLGLLLYSLQIYYDFSGYSDMAIGLAKMMGFSIPENFQHPYSTRSIRDFWRCWHISLSSWFKDYLYIPLGGSRKGATRTYFNLILVFFITGLWHGANYTFIVWGLLHGFLLILERLFPVFFAKMPRFLQHFYVLTMVALFWVFFRIETIGNSIVYIQKLFSFSFIGDYYPLIYCSYYFFTLLLIGICCVFPIRKYIESYWKSNLLKYVSYLGILFICLLELYSTNHTSFIYFQF